MIQPLLHPPGQCRAFNARHCSRSIERDPARRQTGARAGDMALPFSASLGVLPGGRERIQKPDQRSGQ
jgi:hypothetical protein